MLRQEEGFKVRVGNYQYTSITFNIVLFWRMQLVVLIREIWKIRCGPRHMMRWWTKVFDWTWAESGSGFECIAGGVVEFGR